MMRVTPKKGKPAKAAGVGNETKANMAGAFKGAKGTVPPKGKKGK
jgi:hypothetical protein